eukprot:scaffold143730_cov136-Phaeocystis_antarctica.AAC.1
MPLVSVADMARGAAPLLRAMHQELLEVSKPRPPLRCTARPSSLLHFFLASPASLPLTSQPVLEVMRHTADFSFDEIVNAARVPRSASHNPLAQTSC